MDDWMSWLAARIATSYGEQRQAGVAVALPQVMTQVLYEHQLKICDVRLWNRLQQEAEQLSVAGSSAPLAR